MGFFDWLSGLFGKRKARIPDRVIEFKGRKSRKGAKSAHPEYESSYTQRVVKKDEPSPSDGRDLFELAGDRADKKRSEDAARTREAAQAQEAVSEQPAEPAPATPPDPFKIGADEAPEPEPIEQAEPTQEQVAEDDYSPLDLARELKSEPDVDKPESDLDVDDDFPVAHEVPRETEEKPAFEEPEGDRRDALESLDVKFEPGFGDAETAEAEAAPQAVDIPEPVAVEPSPAQEEAVEAADEEAIGAAPLISEAEPAAPVEEVTETAFEPVAAPEPEEAKELQEDVEEEEEDEDEDAHYLDRLKVQTVEGAGTITLERRRTDTKSINIGGESFEIALYEYQNGTRAARVPRAAIKKMTEIAKKNNLKVLPRKQNAAIMAGRFLGLPRAELQERAEKEDYHLVDFTDAYYEICFGSLPDPGDDEGI